MIDKSWSWAENNKLIRLNVVHGEQEAKLVLEESFANQDENGEMTQTTGAGHLED